MIAEVAIMCVTLVALYRMRLEEARKVADAERLSSERCASGEALRELAERLTALDKAHTDTANRLSAVQTRVR